MDPFTPEQQAAIRKVIEGEVARALASQRDAFAEQLRQLQAELARPAVDIGAWARGMAKSWTAWTGGLLVVLPELMEALAPIVTEQWGAEAWKRVVQVIGVVVILLRIKTTQSIPEKGANP